MSHRIWAGLLALLLCLSCLCPAFAAEEDAAPAGAEPDSSAYEEQPEEQSEEESEEEPKETGHVIEVSLQKGASKAKSNYKKLEKALKKGGGSEHITVRIQKPGTYRVHSGGGGALMLRSHTTLDLNGAELVRAGKMTNLLQNCGKKGGRTAKGYGLSCDITVKNGTLNGSGGTKREVNLVNMGHASGLRFQNVDFRNCRSHLLELNGCKDCVVENCTFSGHKGGGTHEAVQLDIANGKAGWNGVYAKGKGSDCTPCKNIRVTGCTFRNYPSGVGNHHTVKGRHNSKIQILNNRFENSKKAKAPAIWCYGFDDSEVSGNVITGKYQYGIRLSGGSVRVKGNTIGSAGKRVGYRAIYILRAHSNRKGGGKRATEKVTGGVVDANTIYSSYSKSSIYITHGSKLASVSGNCLHGGGKAPVTLTGGTKVQRLSGNLKL